MGRILLSNKKNVLRITTKQNQFQKKIHISIFYIYNLRKKTYKKNNGKKWSFFLRSSLFSTPLKKIWKKILLHYLPLKNNPNHGHFATLMIPPETRG